MSETIEKVAGMVRRGLTTTDVFVSTVLLLLSLAFVVFKFRNSGHPQQVSTSSSDLRSMTGLPTRKERISEETARDWAELRMVDVSNVRVSKLLIHPIKVRLTIVSSINP